MATSIHPSIPVLTPFFFIPPLYFSFESKHYSFTSLLPFFLMHTAYYTYPLRNILPKVICCCLPTSCLYVVLLELCYVCMGTFIATVANMGQL